MLTAEVMKEIGAEDVPAPVKVVEQPKHENPFAAIQVPVHFEEEKKSVSHLKEI